MASANSMEIRFWWPLALATVLWLLIVWGFGFFLTSPKIEIASPPPIETHFLELSESKPEQQSIPLPRKSPPTQPEVKPTTPRPVEQEPKPEEQQLPPARSRIPQIQPQSKPKITEKTRPEKPADTTPDTNLAGATDLTEYINQARARRGAAGIFDGPDQKTTTTAKNQPSEEEIRMAKVKRNLQIPGTSGIFQILRMGPRTAEFSFRAWTTGSSNPRRELIEVDAGPGGDIQLAIIRRMIQLIRQYHQGDFNWESHRLNRIVVLSARVENSKELEYFLMREFFDDNAAPYMR